MVMKKEPTLIAITVALAALLVVGLLYHNAIRTSTGNNVLGIDPFRPADAGALPSVEGGTREKLAGTVVTPGLAGDSSTAINADTLPVEGAIAVPETVQKISGNVARRVFSISADNNAFNPPNIIVNEGDVVVIKFTAVDKNYDVSFPDFGIYEAFAKGTTQQISFQAYPYGDYRFFCTKACSGSPAGRLIVNQNQ